MHLIHLSLSKYTCSISYLNTLTGTISQIFLGLMPIMILWNKKNQMCIIMNRYIHIFHALIPTEVKDRRIYIQKSTSTQKHLTI